jgi:uncharacterized protein (TIGR02147 family)
MKSHFSIFEYNDYKSYLNMVLDQRALQERGQRTKFADYLGCRPSYISAVLKEHQNLSPEQAQAANEFLEHTQNESEYFLTLVLHERAGTLGLRKLYADKLQKLHEQSLMVRNRVKKGKTLSEGEQARYYSTWYFAAIHMIVSIKAMRTKESISLALGLPLKIVNESVEFLIELGLLAISGSELKQGETNLLIGADSPFWTRHQMNWRTMAIRSLDEGKSQDLHYSGVITCSLEDAMKIRERMMATIQDIRGLVQASNHDETLMVYDLDLFGLLKK